MSSEIYSENAVVKAIISGTAPAPARMAAARGILPLSQQDMLEVLVHLASSEDPELAETAKASLNTQDDISLMNYFELPIIPPKILGYFAEKDNLAPEIHRRIVSNTETPDESIAIFARKTKVAEFLEIISLNQQRLIRHPAIIDAIIENPFRNAEAERRAQETKREFFEKERGAQQIANELRAKGQEAAAEFIEQAESADNLDVSGAMLLAEHFEVPDAEIDDSWLSLEFVEEFYEETPEEREAIAAKIIGELKSEDAITGERIAVIAEILKMTMKDRVKAAMKGDREVRNVLIRDPNRVVAQAVIQNPRITEQEVEKIASMRSVPEDVLRQVAINRAWVRNYNIMHNLARNPRTPMANVVTILARLQLKDLENLSKSKNIAEAVRKQAQRLVASRKGRPGSS